MKPTPAKLRPIFQGRAAKRSTFKVPTVRPAVAAQKLAKPQIEKHVSFNVIRNMMNAAASPSRRTTPVQKAPVTTKGLKQKRPPPVQNVRPNKQAPVLHNLIPMTEGSNFDAFAAFPLPMANAGRGSAEVTRGEPGEDASLGSFVSITNPHVNAKMLEPKKQLSLYSQVHRIKSKDWYC